MLENVSKRAIINKAFIKGSSCYRIELNECQNLEFDPEFCFDCVDREGYDV